MARKLFPSKKTTTEIAKRKKRKTSKLRIENFETDLGLSYWYYKAEFSVLRWSIFHEGGKNSIWEANLSSLDYSRQFMCPNWIDTLGEKEREEAVTIIDQFLSKYSNVAEMFKCLSNLRAEKVAEKLVEIGMGFGFNKSINENLGLKFDGKSQVKAPIISFENFCKVIKSALSHQSPFEYPSRRDFVEALLCNLLKVYVKCIVDAIRNLFIARVKRKKIKTWESRTSRAFLEYISSKAEGKTCVKDQNNNNNDNEIILWDLYSENELSCLKYRVFLENESLENLWEENWTSLNFAQRFMGDDWLCTLTVDERSYVMEIIDEFLITHSNVSSFFGHYKTLKVNEVVEILSHINVYPTFKQTFIKNVTNHFENRFIPSKRIMPCGMFRDFMKLVPSSHFESRPATQQPVRHVEFFQPFISKLLYIQIRCIVDGIRSLFTCRIENEKVKWEVDTRGSWKYYEDQGWNQVDLGVDKIGWTDFGIVETKEEKEEEEEDQKPCPNCI